MSTPFDGDPSDPIVLIPDHLTHIDDDLLRTIKHRMRRPPRPTTIRWHTFGMPAARDTVIPEFAARVVAARASRRQLRPDARGCLAGTDDAYAIDRGVEAILQRRRPARRS